ncbi:Caveolin-2 [Cymbomonas tetramitiformis]|uniref:Caveolin-2 n=1 Tax=Cymbomonas tetramitiformis TaxID=36881 RepID=A0AAE0FR98_9CHLO|nr:Caveolin-2 [Cymbomonas tetramitiformis]
MSEEDRSFSLYIFDPDHPFRNLCTRIVGTPIFIKVMTVAIIVTVCLLFLDTLSGEPLFYAAELACLACFVVELFLKVVSLGFFSYMKDSVNVMDFVCTIANAISIFPFGLLGLPTSVVSVAKSLRTFRALQPIRTFRYPELQLILQVLLRSVPLMGNVFVAAMFFYLLLGIIGVQMFQGLLQNRCHYLEEDGSVGAVVPAQYINGHQINPRTCMPVGYESFTDGYHCELNEVCAATGENPKEGTNGFDNILVAVYTIFQCTTLDSWSDVQYNLMDSAGSIAAVYAVVIVWIGAFVVMNLSLAVIYDSYTSCKRQELMKQAELKLLEKEKDYVVTSTEAIRNFNPFSDPSTFSFLKLRFCAHNAQTDSVPKEVPKDDSNLLQAAAGSSPPDPNMLRACSQTIGRMTEDFTEWLKSRKLVARRHALVPVEEGSPVVFYARELWAWLCKTTMMAVGPVRDYMQKSCRAVAESDAVQGASRKCTQWVESPVMQHLITLLIVASTILLMADHYRAPAWLGTMIDIVGYICTAVFTVEMLLKFVSIGLPKYFSELYTILDFVVVATSFLEIMLSVGQGFVVLRLFRFLRLMRTAKLVQNWNAMKVFLSAMTRACEAFMPFYVLILIFVMTTSLFGNQLFEDKFSIGRFNYDTILISCLSTFKVLLGPGWSQLVMEGVSSEGWWAAIFFIGIYVIGNMIFLNVYAAILIESYCAETSQVDEAEDLTNGNSKHEDKPNKLHGNSFLIFSPGNRFRMTLARIVYSPVFEGSVICLILTSSAMLTLHSATTEEGSFEEVLLRTSSLVFSIIFVVEMLLKMIVMQAFIGEDAYIKSNWNRLDFFVVLVSILGGIFPEIAFLRVLRAFRPVRLIMRFRGFRFVMSTIAECILKSLTTIAIASTIALLFSIMGVQFFSGAFYHCTDLAVTTIDECTGAYMTEEGVEEERKWKMVTRFSYDNIGAALITTFELTIGEAWYSILEAGMDTVGEGQAMKTDASPWNALYFVVVMLLMKAFFLNVIVGIVVDAARCLRERSLYPGLDREEKDWMVTLDSIVSTNPSQMIQVPKSFLRRELYFLVTSTWFEAIMIVCIVVNCMLMMLAHYKQSQELEDFLALMHMVFTQIFMLEVVLKITALGSEYFKNGWNLFDLVVVFFGYIESYVLVTDGLQFLTALRVLRLVRLIRSMKGTGPLFRAMFEATVALRNVLGLILLIVYMYAVAGVSLFGNVKLQAYVGPLYNFRTFPSAMLTLFRVATGDGWNGIMHDLRVQEPDCSEAAGDCGSWLAVPFVVSFVMLVQLVMLNIVVAIVLEKYSDCQLENVRIVNQDVIHEFKAVWRKYDIQASGFAPLECLYDIMVELPPPLGLNRQEWTARMFLPIASKLNLAVYTVPFGASAARGGISSTFLGAQSSEFSRNASKRARNIKDHVWKSLGNFKEALTRTASAREVAPESTRDCISFQDTLAALAGRIYMQDVAQTLPKHQRQKLKAFVHRTLNEQHEQFVMTLQANRWNQEIDCSQRSQNVEADVVLPISNLPVECHLMTCRESFEAYEEVAA